MRNRSNIKQINNFLFYSVGEGPKHVIIYNGIKVLGIS